jgi:hypothetical protein
MNKNYLAEQRELAILCQPPPSSFGYQLHWWSSNGAVSQAM